MQCIMVDIYISPYRWDFQHGYSHMRNLFQNAFKSQGRANDQNALHLPKPQYHLFIHFYKKSY